jgi:ribosomal protein S18 acetylase RimI-like enzyme
MIMSHNEKDMGLLPIMSPLYNLREICKQMALLEDHLNQPRKRCGDCIRKHFLTIEALFEEAISLDKDFQYGEHLDGKAEEVRTLQGAWLDFKDTENSQKAYLMLAQALRAMRKSFAPLCFDVRKMASIERTASAYVCTHKMSRTAYRMKPADKKVIDAFVMERPLDGRALRTDGKKLFKLSLMEAVFARWVGGKILITSQEATKSDEVMLRYLIKKAGKGMVRFNYEREGHALPITYDHGGDALYADQYDAYVIAKIGHKVIGRVDFVLYKEDDEDKFAIKMVEVLPEYRRGGIATKMYEYMRKTFKLKASQEENRFRTEDGGAFRESFRFATKTQAEKEDEATQKLIRRSPKSKPPRKDLRKNRVEMSDDPDLQGVGRGDSGDQDLSRRSQKMASRIAFRYINSKR